MPIFYLYPDDTLVTYINTIEHYNNELLPYSIVLNVKYLCVSILEWMKRAAILVVLI